jgi:hypothetical protein
MPETELPWIFTEPLETAEIPYMLVGAYAVIAFGMFRTTNDLDLVVALHAGAVRKIEAAFPDTEFYRPPREVLMEESARPNRGHFNLIHHATGWKADCYPVGSDELQLWGLRNRRCITHEGRTVWVAPPEVVILKKLEFFREGGSTKHITDIREVLRLVDVDRSMIGEHVDRLGLTAQWADCQLPQ